MKQQVNLYQDEFRPRKEVLSAQSIVQLSGLFIVGLLVWYGYAYSHLQDLRAVSRVMSADMGLEMAKIETLSQQYPIKEQSKLLNAQILRLEKQVRDKQRVVSALSGRALGNTTGLSPQFEALARSHVEGLWLTNISVGLGGTILDLQGSALSPELVPVFIRQLAKSEAFAGINFSNLEISRSEDDAARVDFLLTTRLQDES